MALGLGEGSEMRTPMAITVIGGLLTSTLLTLVVVPVMYSLLDRREDVHVSEYTVAEHETERGLDVDHSRMAPAPN